MSSFHLQIVTPDGSFFDGEANSVVVRTTGGYVSIYPHHTDYIAALDIGRVVVTKDGGPRHAACGGGFPIKVEEVGVIGVIVVAGMDPVADHDLIVKCIGRYLHVDEVPRIRSGL